MGKTMGW